MKKIQTVQSLLQKQVLIEKAFELVKCNRLFASFTKHICWDDSSLYVISQHRFFVISLAAFDEVCFKKQLCY